MKALSKDPRQRQQSMEELLRGAAALLRLGPLPALARARAPRRIPAAGEAARSGPFSEPIARRTAAASPDRRRQPRRLGRRADPAHPAEGTPRGRPCRWSSARRRPPAKHRADRAGDAAAHGQHGAVARRGHDEWSEPSRPENDDDWIDLDVDAPTDRRDDGNRRAPPSAPGHRLVARRAASLSARDALLVGDAARGRGDLAALLLVGAVGIGVAGDGRGHPAARDDDRGQAHRRRRRSRRRRARGTSTAGRRIEHLARRPGGAAGGDEHGADAGQRARARRAARRSPRERAPAPTATTPGTRRETVRGDRSSISSTEPRLCRPALDFHCRCRRSRSSWRRARRRPRPRAPTRTCCTGPHPFLKDNELSAHVLIANGLGDSMSGTKLAFDYGYKLCGRRSPLWLDLALNLQHGACTPVASQRAPAAPTPGTCSRRWRA